MEDHVAGAPTVGIGRLLKEGGEFLIPHHQRDYSWGEDQLQQLFHDVEEAQNSNQDEYFLGLMVFMPTGSRKFTILDGQQRLATTTIVLASIRGWLNARGLHTDAQQIQSEYIASRKLGGGEDYEPSLVLNQSNDDEFRQHIINERPIEEVQRELRSLSKYNPNRALLEAIVFCRERVDEIGFSENGDIDSGAQRLYTLVEYLRDNVKVVRLNVQSEVNAYTVFETLNDRGLDLSVLDLAKNHLFGKAQNEEVLRDMQSRWTQMTANLTNVRADDFLKTWWISRYGRVQKPQLFAEFKALVSSKQAALNVSRDLLSASEKYAALEIADDPLWSGSPAETRERIKNLKILSAQQAHAVLLSAVERFQGEGLKRLLWLLEVLIVRYQLIGGGRTGDLEIACARLAHRIFQGKCSSTSEAFTIIKDIFPTDAQFRDNFKTKQERGTQKARYILACLEIQERRARKDSAFAAELEPSNTLTLEHVLPKSPDDNWATMLEGDPEFAEEGTYRLGNLCLLTQVNQTLGNRSFDAKKTYFGRSELLLTNHLSELENWNRSKMESRQSRMAKLAVDYWRVDY